MTSLPRSLSPMTSHPHRCCCCYPLWDTMLQCEHPLSGSRPSGTEYDCMPRCHILSCTPWCVCRSACSISSSDARSTRVFHPCYLVPCCQLPRFHRPHSETWTCSQFQRSWCIKICDFWQIIISEAVQDGKLGNIITILKVIEHSVAPRDLQWPWMSFKDDSLYLLEIHLFHRSFKSIFSQSTFAHLCWYGYTVQI